MKEWSQRLSEDFPTYKKVEDLEPTNTVYTGIVLPYKDISDAIAVRIEIAGKSLYYGLTYMPETKTMRSELQDAMSFVNDGDKYIKGSDWLYYKYLSFEDAYEKLKELIEKMTEWLSGHLGSGLEKRIAIFVEKSGDSQEDNAAASQDGFIKMNGDNIWS